MKITRKWAMPTPNTFECPPIGDLVKRYLQQSSVSIDPFARNNNWATYTNDLNPDTEAEHHMDVLDFLLLLRNKNIQADLLLLDPPYSPRQIKEVYDAIGLTLKMTDTQRICRWSQEKDVANELLIAGAYSLTFGWNSQGMGKVRGWEIIEILLVCHGGAHNDTICTVEQKIAHQLKLENLS